MMRNEIIMKKTDEDGEVELIPISEVVAKSLREAKNYV
jgi:hypothetical protein